MAPALARQAEALRRTRTTLVALLQKVPGFPEAYAAVAREELSVRPRLDTLKGRARLLEEIRRDLLLDPTRPLPEPLEELLGELPEDGPQSPPVRLFDLVEERR